MERSTEKRSYVRPAIEDFGNVVDLTATGQTQPGGDLKQGSVSSQGG
jgi:hypothetical protein